MIDMTRTRPSKDESLEEHLRPAPEAGTAEYEAWKKQKVEAALAQAEERSQMIPADKVWEKLGLER